MDFQEVIPLLKEQDIRIISGKGKLLDRLQEFLPDTYSRREMEFLELTGRFQAGISTAEVKLATEADAMEIATAYGQIEEFNGLYNPEVGQRYEQIVNRIRSNEGIHMLIKINEEIVSHGNSTAETRTNGMLGGIFTIPEYRHRGFASKVVSALCLNLEQRGKSVCLFHNNPEAGRIFERLGFQKTNTWVMLETRQNPR